jgi:hypothetical protein
MTFKLAVMPNQAFVAQGFTGMIERWLTKELSL